MKTRKLPQYLVSLALLALVAGCGTMGGMLTPSTVVTSAPVGVSETNLVETVTGQVSIEVTPTPSGDVLKTNLVSITNTTPVVVWRTNLVLLTNTVYGVAPRVEAALATGQAIAAAVPSPWAPVASGALGLVSLVLGWFARVKSRQAADLGTQVTAATAELSSIGAQLGAVVAGVEKVGHTDTKAAIAKAATLRGVAPALHATVKKATT